MSSLQSIHLAILLSQGSKEAVAVTGNTDRSALLVFKRQDNLHISFRENADCGASDKDSLKVQEIELSTMGLHDLADFSMNQEVALAVHASDLFKALIDLSNDCRQETKTEFMRFICLRCHRKMEESPAWCLEDADVVKETHFRVHSNLYQFFDSFEIPYQTIQGTTYREYLFSRSTAPLKVFANVKDLAERCDMELASIDELNWKFFTLNSLLYHNRAFETILALRSLENRVIIALNDKKRDNPNEEFDEDSDAPFDEGLHQGRSPLVRCCMAMVAWHRAGLSLSRSKIFKDRLPKFHMVLSYRSVYNSSMADLETIM